MFQSIISHIESLDLEEKIKIINEIREKIHEISPFKNEPVDFVRWVKKDSVYANDYNPNSVAPPEMKLLAHSILSDGYTQPIVTYSTHQGQEVVDGFHRNRVGKENEEVCARVLGYLPVVSIKESQSDKSDRIASTIRHNRARGKHKVEAMSDIVIELKRRNWSDEKIAKNLGMDADEVLRLCQITGLAEAFKDQGFSEAWEVNRDNETGMEIISDVISGFEHDDNGRIFHTWDRWECYKAGFYAERPKGMTHEEGEIFYRDFLSDLDKFREALESVTAEWRFSCEHYLTNNRMNRIAWLGQASVAYALGVPSVCRGGYNMLSDEQKSAADALALEYLNKWLVSNGRDAVDYDLAGGKTKADLY
jgi:ParB-like chromosome segregation protein Spo0J